MTILRAAFLAAFTLAAVPAVAAPWVLDKSHAHVTFSVDHLGYSQTQGQFRVFDADIDFDPTAVETSRVSFTIDAASVDTGWAKRDEHIRSKDFFDVANHPKITFVSTKVEKTGADTARVTGKLTLLGKTMEEVFEAKLNKLAPSPFNPQQQIAGFTVTGSIDRTKYGMTTYAPALGAIIPVKVFFEISPK